VTDLAAQLRALADRADTLDPAEVCGALEALKLRIWLAATPAPTETRVSESDGLLDAAEAAALLGRSESWVRKRGRSLPGFCQPTGHGGRVRWARAALLAWRNGGY